MMSTCNMTAVAAMNNKRVIGANNAIPWHSKEDFAHFKDITAVGVLIMGRKTWDSLPRKPLPGRISIVVTRDVTKFLADNAELLSQGQLVMAAPSLERAVWLAHQIQGNYDSFIIGGEQIYREAIEKGLVDCVELTLVDNDADGDTFMPEFEHLFERVNEKKLLDTDPKLTFISFRRK